MKSKQEIEEYLGIKIEPYYIREVESIYGEEQIAYDRYVFGQRIPANYTETKALPKKAEDALKKLIKESIENNDMETAATCHSILRDNTSSYREITSIDGLNKEQLDQLALYEQEQNEKNKREWEEIQARIIAEQEAKEKAEEQARLKAEQEAKEKAEEQARLKAEQEAKQRAEEQTRLKAEQEAKEQAEQEAKRQVEERANSDEVDYLIEEISSNNYSAWYGKSALEMDTEIKNKVKTLENKIKELEQNGDEAEIQQNIQMLNDRIEKLEDAWEIYTQCFDSKSSFSMRNSSSNMFREFRTNYISISKSIELFERFQKGEEVPELYGKHHRERYEREQAKAEEQARLKAEQEEKERQASIEKDIAEFEQYEELVSRKPELEQLFQDMFYEDFSAASNGRISERMVELLEDLKKLPDNERKIILQRYNGLADMKINENGQIIKDGVVQDLPKRNANEQENSQEEQIEVEIRDDELEDQFAETTSGLDYDKMIEDDLEYTRNHQTYQQSQVVEDYWNRVNSQQAKEYEQQQPERIRPREESIRDTVGDKKDTQNQMQMQETKTPTVDLWMNRFDSWYSAIDRVSQNVKAKFVKMKSDIINAISNKIKDRMNKREVNTQEKDSSER